MAKINKKAVSQKAVSRVARKAKADAKVSAVTLEHGNLTRLTWSQICRINVAFDGRLDCTFWHSKSEIGEKLVSSMVAYIEANLENAKSWSRGFVISNGVAVSVEASENGIWKRTVGNGTAFGVVTDGFSFVTEAEAEKLFEASSEVVEKLKDGRELQGRILFHGEKGKASYESLFIRGDNGRLWIHNLERKSNKYNSEHLAKRIKG